LRGDDSAGFIASHILSLERRRVCSKNCYRAATVGNKSATHGTECEADGLFSAAWNGGRVVSAPDSPHPGRKNDSNSQDIRCSSTFCSDSLYCKCRTRDDGSCA